MSNTPNSSNLVIIAYKAKEGKYADLVKLVSEHHPRLLGLGLVTDRKPIIAEATDETIIEVFEWLSDEAIQNSHTNPDVQKMWGEFFAVCDYIPLATLPQAANMFAGFKPLN
jgi:hypothetical protein